MKVWEGERTAKRGRERENRQYTWWCYSTVDIGNGGTVREDVVGGEHLVAIVVVDNVSSSCVGEGKWWQWVAVTVVVCEGKRVD